MLGAMFLAPRARGQRPAEGGADDPGRAHQVAVRRGRGLRRTRRDLRARSTPTSSARRSTSSPTVTRNTPEEFRAALHGRLAAVGQHRRAGRGAQHAAAEPRARSPGCSATASEDIIGLMKDGDRAVPGAGRPPRGDPQPAGRRPASCPASSPGWSRDTRADLKPALDNLYGVVRPAREQPGRTSTTACG